MAGPSELTCGQECQKIAKLLSSFIGPSNSAIPSNFISNAMAIATCFGDQGVACVRLPSGEWYRTANFALRSAPCAILAQSPNRNVVPGQETVFLFMNESPVFALIGRTPLIFNQTHSFQAGPLYSGQISPQIDVYAYVRFNNGFTPTDLIQQHMNGWTVQEDIERHTKWHGSNATWFDVLTNKISVDRSSVGNALYLILGLGAQGNKNERKNFAEIEQWAQRIINGNQQAAQQIQQNNQSSFQTNYFQGPGNSAQYINHLMQPQQQMYGNSMENQMQFQKYQDKPQQFNYQIQLQQNIHEDSMPQYHQQQYHQQIMNQNHQQNSNQMGSVTQQPNIQGFQIQNNNSSNQGLNGQVQQPLTAQQLYLQHQLRSQQRY